MPNHVQERTPRPTQTGHEVLASAEEDGEAEVAAGKEAEKEMTHPAWALIVIGGIIVGIGLVWLLAPSIPWLGKLPGDIRIESGDTRIYIPITTCIVLSLLLTGIMWLVRYFTR